MTIWLTEWEAAKHVDRSRYTIRDWRVRGYVQARKRKNLWEYDKVSLERARFQMERNYLFRRIVPGSGRGRRIDRDSLIPLWED